MNVELEGRKFVRGFRTFAIITIAALLLLGILTTDRNTWIGLTTLRPAPLLLVLGLVFLSWLTTALKVKTLIEGIGGRAGVRTCLRAHLANMFLSCVTPFQTGGGPAQLYVLWRKGLSLSSATAASLIGALITIVILFASGLAVLLVRPGLVDNLAMRAVIIFVMTMFGAVFFLFWVGFSKPTWAASVIRGFAWVLARVPLMPAARIWEFHDRLARELNDLIRYLRLYLTGRTGTLLKATVYGLVSVLANCLVAYAVLLGMGIRQDPAQVVMAQALIYFIVYFSPTPGASGVAEMGGASLMSGLVPTQQLMVYVVLWRFFFYLLGVGLGAIVMMGLLKKSTLSAEDVPCHSRVAIAGDPGEMGVLEPAGSVHSDAARGKP